MGSMNITVTPDDAVMILPDRHPQVTIVNEGSVTCYLSDTPAVSASVYDGALRPGDGATWRANVACYACSNIAGNTSLSITQAVYL
jgi:hypothetical protein